MVLIGLISALLRQVARRVLHPFGWFSYFNEPLIRSNLSALRPGFMAGFRTPTASVPSFGARIGTFNPIRTLKIRARKWQTQLISTLNLTRMKERWARIGARLIRYWGRLNGRPTGRAFLGCPSRAVHLTRSISTYPSSQFVRNMNFIFLSLLHLQAADWSEL